MGYVGAEGGCPTRATHVWDANSAVYTPVRYPESHKALWPDGLHFVTFRCYRRLLEHSHSYCIARSSKPRRACPEPCPERSRGIVEGGG